MKVFTCAAARRRLHALYDGELPVADQIAVEAHLDWCETCATALSDLRLVGSMLRAGAHSRESLSREEAAGFNAAVVGQLKAEREASFVARVQATFEDMHLVYVGLSAAAPAVCVMIMLGLMWFATRERPDSVATIVNVPAAPGSNENPVAIDGRVRMPRPLDATFSAASNQSGEDALFMLAAVVTREGRIANLELLRASSGKQAAIGTHEAQLVEGLLDTVSRARFEPARVAGLPVAVNMVWLVAHTTVRANKNQVLNMPAPPPVKKRTA